MKELDLLREIVKTCPDPPNVEGMPRRDLAQKGIYGPTGAHVIEEVHTPFNLAYITVTTGTTAFQNITGVTHQEIPDRINASLKALSLAGVKKGDHLLFTYPPLVNVFVKDALEQYGLTWSFLERSSRDACILAMCEMRPQAVIGESAFLKATLIDAKRMGFLHLLPKEMILITAGTPLDTELTEIAAELAGCTVHDLYGCQEFGWLTLDGIPVRDDITLIPADKENYYDLVAGGLPTGDCFAVSEKGHLCNPKGKIITYSRIRTGSDYEVTVLETTASSEETIERLTRTILRIKAKIVRVSKDLKVSCKENVLSLSRFDSQEEPVILRGHDNTVMFDYLLDAQLKYQAESKTDPAWIK